MKVLQIPVVRVTITWNTGKKDEFIVQDTPSSVLPEIVRDHLREAKRNGVIREYSVERGSYAEPIRHSRFMGWLQEQLYRP